uniref:Uncharacterized protein n=1 Tax=Oryzias latipes TaxID=8090 RepID=A0A3P9M585_ORYLA
MMELKEFNATEAPPKATDKYLALLDYRATKLKYVGLSSALLLMGRRPHNNLPTARALLKPMSYDSNKVKCLLNKTKHIQKHYHNRRKTTQLSFWQKKAKT